MGITAVLRVIAAGDGAGGDEGYLVSLVVDGESEIAVPLGALGSVADYGEAFARGADDEDRAKAGEQLFAALLGGGLAQKWSELHSRAERANPLRVLLVIEPPQLRSLPWELMCHQGRWLWRRRELLFRRGVIPQDGPGGDELGPLRVLVVIATSDASLLVEQELAAISGALESSPGRVHLEVLDCPGSADVLAHVIDRLRPHVLHFIGHGMPRAAGGSAELVFTPAEGNSWELGGEDIGDLARWLPLLVVLNACRTAQAEPSDCIGGIAYAYLDVGVRAVVSMQGDIESDAAVVFSARFYKELEAHRPIDVCLAEARSALANRPGRTGSWALPVLLTRRDPAAVLPIVFRPPAPLDGITSQQFVDLRRFVGRSDERRQVWWALDDPSMASPAADSSSVLLVSGRSQLGVEQTGKTWLTNWCLLTWFLRGHRVVSVNLATRRGLRMEGYGSRAKDWLGAIRMIRDEATSANQLCPLPRESFAEFNAALNHFVAGGSGSARSGCHSTDDEWQEFNDDAGHADERKAGILEAFLIALRKAAQGQPLVIVLDHAEKIMPESFVSELNEGLVRPIACGMTPPLRLVLVAPHWWVGQVLPDSDAHLITRVQLGDFRQSQFMRLARAYSSRLGIDPDAHTMAMLEAFHGLPVEYFSIDLFHTLAKHVPQWRTAIA